MAKTKIQRRESIKKRIRSIVTGTSDRPRLAVFRSNKEIYAQVIDDVEGKTVLQVSSLNNKETKGKSKLEQATIVGKMIAELAKKAGVESVRFDRGGYLYHGRVKNLAEGAREGGLNF